MVSKTSMATVSISAFACVLQMAVAIVQTTLTISVLSETDIYGLALVASVLDIICLPMLAAAIVFRLRQMHHRIILPFYLASTVVLVTASALTIYCMVWTEGHLHGDVKLNGSQPLVEVGIALSGLALVILVIFYAVLLWLKPPQTTSPGLEYGPQRYQPIKSVVGSSLASLSTTPFFAQSLGVSTISFATPSSHSSMRSPIVSALRPTSSKANSSFRGSYASTTTRSSHATIPISIVAVREDDGFHDWFSTTDGDSTFSEKTSGKVLKSGKPDIPRLATIAGSRPVSPANQIRTSPNKIRGGAEQRPPHISTPLRPEPHGPPPLPTLTIPPRLKVSKSESSLRSTRSASPSKPNSHIHPLFRSESAGPLPIASPGTVITASPMAGQVVRQEQALRSVRSVGLGSPIDARSSPLILLGAQHPAVK